jgi:hypothetical protein
MGTGGLYLYMQYVDACTIDFISFQNIDVAQFVSVVPPHPDRAHQQIFLPESVARMIQAL